MYPTYSQLWDADIERSMLFPFNREFFLQSLLSFPGLKIIWPFQETSGSVALATNDALALGRELVVNGDFAADITGWVAWLTPDTHEWSAGRLHCIGDTSDGTSQTMPRTAGKTYNISVDYEVVSGSIRLAAAGLVTTGTLTGTGTYTNNGVTQTTSGIVNTVFQAIQDGTEFYLDNVSVKQTDIAASSASPGAEELSEAGDGTADKDNWTAIGNATLTNPSTGILRIARNGTNNPRAAQATLIAGKRYLQTAQARSDGNAIPRVLGPSSLAVWIGTNSTEWQNVSVEFVPTAVSVQIVSQTSTGTEYTEWRNLSVTEVNPLNGDIIGCTIGQPSGLPGLPYLYSSEGISNYVDIHCAELNSMLDPASDFSIGIVGQSDTWVAGIDYLLRLAVDANNSIEIYRSGTDLVAVFVAGGTAETIIITSGSPSTPFIIEITREGNDFSAYYNGVLDSTETIAGAYVGNLDSTLCAVGAKNITPTNVWAGDYGIPYIFFTRARNADEIAQTAKLLGLLS